MIIIKPLGVKVHWWDEVMIFVQLLGIALTGMVLGAVDKILGHKSYDEEDE